MSNKSKLILDENFAMNEDSIVDAAKKSEESNYNPISTTKTFIEREMDRAYKKAKIQKAQEKAGKISYKNQPVNLLFVSPGGFAKTSAIEQWANKHPEVNLVPLKAQEIVETDITGYPYLDENGQPTANRELAVEENPEFNAEKGVEMMKQAGKVLKFAKTTKLDDLDKPNTILFLDEYNRALFFARSPLLTLVQDHSWPAVGQSSGETRNKLGRYFPNLLFTVACINPSFVGGGASNNVNDLDDAEEGRFVKLIVPFEPKVYLDYLDNYFDERIEWCKNNKQGDENLGLTKQDIKDEFIKYLNCKGIAHAIFDSSQFQPAWNKVQGSLGRKDAEDKAFTPRNFLIALEHSDGTKSDFLDTWEYCLPTGMKSLAETLLSDYVDIDDKANQALEFDSESGLKGISRDKKPAKKVGDQTTASGLKKSTSTVDKLLNALGDY